MFSGTTSNKLRIGREATQQLTIIVEDNDMSFEYIQDSDADGDHEMKFINSALGTGENNIAFYTSGSKRLDVMDDGTISQTGPVWVGDSANGTWADGTSLISGEYINLATTSTAQVVVEGDGAHFNLIDINGTSDKRIFRQSLNSDELSWRIVGDTGSGATFPMTLNMTDGSTTWLSDMTVNSNIISTEEITADAFNVYDSTNDTTLKIRHGSIFGFPFDMEVNIGGSSGLHEMYLANWEDRVIGLDQDLRHNAGAGATFAGLTVNGDVAFNALELGDATPTAGNWLLDTAKDPFVAGFSEGSDGLGVHLGMQEGTGSVFAGTGGKGGIFEWIGKKGGDTTGGGTFDAGDGSDFIVDLSGALGGDSIGGADGRHGRLNVTGGEAYFSDIIYADRLVLGQLNESVNSSLNISSGDIVGDIAYFNAFMGRSPPPFCDQDDMSCTVFFPKYHKFLDVNINEDWTIIDIFYDGQSYTTQEFNSQICSGSGNARKICDKLIAKFQTLQNNYQADLLLKQQKEACDYRWNGKECFEIVRVDTDYNGAVESYETNKTEEYSCTKLDSVTLQEVDGICIGYSSETETAYKFKEDCSWYSGYYCEVRDLR